MPLSDDEEKILAEIEANIRKSDPDLAQHVEQTNIFRYSGKRLALSSLGIVILLGVIVATFTNAWPIAFAAFGAMVVVGISLANHITKIGRAGVGEARDYAQRKSASPWKTRGQ